MESIIIYHTELNVELSDDKFKELFTNLPVELQQKIASIKHLATRNNKLVGLSLLAHALNDKGYSNKMLSSVENGKHGKPFIPNTFEFNIAHSGKMVICAVSKNPIGVDIEKNRPITIENFSSNLTSQEIEQLKQFENHNPLFFDLWTKKEAFAKALGLGMTIPFSKVIIKDDCICYQEKTMHLHSLDFGNDYAACLCSTIQNPNIEFKKVEIINKS